MNRSKLRGVLKISIATAIAVRIFLLPGIQASLEKVVVNASPPDQAVINTLPYVCVAVLILGAVAWIGIGSPERLRTYLNWKSFGNRMKEAYASKFGYRNEAFDQEVDMHIKAMRTLGNGFTRDLDREWLQRMAQFVEVPWSIPEEESLSEEDKTRQFEEE